MSVSFGVIERILKEERVENPILKVVSIKSVSTSNSNYRLTGSDNVGTIALFGGTFVSSRVVSGEIKEGSLIKLKNFTLNTVADNKILAVLEFDIVGFESLSEPSRANPNPTVFKSVEPIRGASGIVSSEAKQYSGQYAAPGQSISGNQNQSYTPKTSDGSSYQASSSSYSTSYGNTSNSAYKAVGRNSEGDSSVVPIAAINPYSNKYELIEAFDLLFASLWLFVGIVMLLRWTIKARITNKSEKRRWSNAKGEGTLFSVDLLDSDGNEIRGTFFKDACEKFFDVLEESKVYYFSGGRVKVVANKQFSAIKNNYEITFDSTSEIRPCLNDNTIQSHKFNFVSIKSIAQLDPDSMVDIIGIVQSATNVSEIVSNKLGGRTLQKRDIRVVDDSNCEIKVTLWGDKATAHIGWEESPIVALKAVKVSDYGGRTLSAMNNTLMLINPDLPEGFRLHNWRSQFSNGQVPSMESLSGSSGAMVGDSMGPLEKRKTILDISNSGVNSSNENGDLYSIKGTFCMFKNDEHSTYTYCACPTSGCNKKVTQTTTGGWRCEKCNEEFNACQHRYIFSASLQDYSGSFWFNFFNESGEKLFGLSANEMNDLMLSNRSEYDRIIQRNLFKTIVAKVRVKQEMYGEDVKKRATVIKFDFVNFADESKQLLAAISKYN